MFGVAGDAHKPSLWNMFSADRSIVPGNKREGGKPREKMSGAKWVARLLVYLVLCAFLAHTFLAYFIGVERLAQWVRQSPFEHPIPFLVMATATGLMMFDFVYFREQTCLIVCPYGRFQSVMLDRRSLIVSYDHVRGEPRGPGKRTEERANAAKGIVSTAACAFRFARPESTFAMDYRWSASTVPSVSMPATT